MALAEVSALPLHAIMNCRAGNSLQIFLAKVQRYSKMRGQVAGIIALILVSAIASAQAASSHMPIAVTDEDILARIVGYSLIHGGASELLETLTDTIGGRVTGSPQCHATAELILRR